MSCYYRHNPDEPIRHDWTRPIDHAEDEADCLRDWRRDVSAEAALALPGLEPGPDTLSPLDEPVAGTKPTNQQNERPITNETETE